MNLRFVVVLAAATGVAGCTSDLPAPNNYVESSPGSASDTSGDLNVDCEMLPGGAVGAQYSFTPDVMLDDPTATWMAATDLPDGLEIDQTTGEISGVPTTAGEATLDVVLTTMSGTSSYTCTIDISDQLAVDNELVLSTAPFCNRPGGMTVLDMVVEGTGDGSPITCSTPGGTGNGRLPAGVSVNADTCAIEGNVTDDRYGTWVFIVRGEQNGAEVWVPYCVSNETNNGYAFSIDHTGLSDMGQDGTLVPIFRRFNPDAAISIGGGGDPYFEVRDRDSCGDSGCGYRFSFNVNSSPFVIEDTTGLLAPDELLFDDTGRPVGLSHELQLDTDGRAIDEEFRDRPWTVNIALDYCIQPTRQECEGDDFDRNAGGFVEFSVLMAPQ